MNTTRSIKCEAQLQAYQILSREHRQTTTLYERIIQRYGLPRIFGIRENVENTEDLSGYQAPSYSALSHSASSDEGGMRSLLKKYNPGV